MVKILYMTTVMYDWAIISAWVAGVLLMIGICLLGLSSILDALIEWARKP